MTVEGAPLDVARTRPQAASAPLLAVEGLRKAFSGRRTFADRLRGVPATVTAAVDDVSFAVAPGEALGIVGESGSGKSTVVRCLLRLQEPDAGTVRFDGIDVRALDRHGMRALSRRVQMVFQDPYGSLNPRLTVRRTIAEPALVHELVTRAEADAHVARMLDLVGLSASVAARHPRELSGGQRQRVAIARALSVQPDLLIADEATSALDVSVQAQILNLLADLREHLGLTLVVIAHQLPLVRWLCNRVVILHDGRVVEEGPVADVFAAPRDSYTVALLAAVPGRGMHAPPKEPNP